MLILSLLKSMKQMDQQLVEETLALWLVEQQVPVWGTEKLAETLRERRECRSSSGSRCQLPE